MKHEIEYMSYEDSQRLGMLENRPAERGRRLGRPAPGYASRDPGTAAYPVLSGDTEAGTWAGPGYREPARRGADAAPWYVPAGSQRGTRLAPGFETPLRTAGAEEADLEEADLDEGDLEEGGYEEGGYEEGGYEEGGYEEPDERTEVLINQGRRNVRRSRRPGWVKHWRAIVIVAACIAIGSFLLSVIFPGASPGWPDSVARVQAQIAVACQNPNVVSEPTQVNFACAKGTRQILWVFSLLTSNDSPGFKNASNGRRGLEPITPAQGGDVAWSLNLHHPYNPASPTDSLEVAARAINNIIGGATLTSSNGAAVVQPGLESKAANCARYTGSAALVTRQGFPAICARPVISPAGQAALVSDVFRQWMVGAPARVAAEAGVLFENADNPGDSRVQAILNTLPRSGL